MNDDQAHTLVVWWQRVKDGLSQMQAATDDNILIQEIESVGEKLTDAVSRAMGNGDGSDWGDIIPFNGEVHPDEARQHEAEEGAFYTPKEEAQIIEHEMWGPPEVSPGGPWL